MVPFRMEWNIDYDSSKPVHIRFLIDRFKQLKLKFDVISSLISIHASIDSIATDLIDEQQRYATIVVPEKEIHVRMRCCMDDFDSKDLYLHRFVFNNRLHRQNRSL